MSFIQRLASFNPSVSASPHLLFTSDGTYVCSVIFTNRGDDVANVSLWVDASNISPENEVAHILSNLPIEPQDAYESFRFAINSDDYVYVESNTASVSFSIFGINQATSASA